MAKIPSVTINVHNIEFNHGDQIVINLIEREEPKPEPQPAHRFKVGDRAVTSNGAGVVEEIDASDTDMPYHVKLDDGGYWWARERDLSPAPEPPKFYTGKVFAEKSIDDYFKARDGHVFKFVDGKCVSGSTADQHMEGRFTSFENFCKMASCTTWHEVKSDV